MVEVRPSNVTWMDGNCQGNEKHGTFKSQKEDWSKKNEYRGVVKNGMRRNSFPAPFVWSVFSISCDVLVVDKIKRETWELGNAPAEKW